MPVQPGQLKSDNKPSLEKMLAEQKEILMEIYDTTRKTRRYIMFGRIMSLLYLLVIIGVFGFAYSKIISPLMDNFNNIIGPYQELLDVQQGSNNIDMGTVSNILKELGR